LRDLAKLGFFKLIMSKSSFKKSYEFIVRITWPKNVITSPKNQLTSQDFSFWAPHNKNFWLLCGVALALFSLMVQRTLAMPLIQEAESVKGHLK